ARFFTTGEPSERERARNVKDASRAGTALPFGHHVVTVAGWRRSRRSGCVTLGMVGDITVEGGVVRIPLRPGTDKPEVREQLVRSIEAALARVPGVERIALEIAGAEAGRGKDPFAGRSSLPGVRHVIAVASAKGGVGKSTVAANLACALAGEGRRTGLLDADVYGPSIDVMFGTDARPQVSQAKRIRPLE